MVGFINLVTPLVIYNTEEIELLRYSGAVDNSQGINSRIKIIEWYGQITDKADANTMNYMETRMRKNHGVLWCAKISGFKSPPHWKGSAIYAGCVCLDKVAECSVLFKHLTTYI